MNGRPQPLVIGLIGVIFVLLAVIGFTVSRSMNPTPTPAPAETADAAPSPEPTLPPAAVMDSTPAPTPSPVPGAGTIAFGRSVDRMKLSGKGDSFAPDDVFAFVATSGQPFAATSLEATLARRNGSAEQFLRRWTVDIPGPESNQLSQSFSRADGFLETSEPGTYIFRLIRDNKTICKGTFTLTAIEDSVPEETIDPGEEPVDITNWRSYRSDTIGVRFAAPEGWSVASGRDGEEVYISIRRSETPPISLRLVQNPPSSFDAQERDKRQAFGKNYKRIERNTDREFHGIPAETWSFTEPSDSGVLKRILKFQFDQGGHRWEFVIVAPQAEYDSYREDFNRIIDRMDFS